MHNLSDGSDAMTSDSDSESDSPPASAAASAAAASPCAAAAASSPCDAAASAAASSPRASPQDAEPPDGAVVFVPARSGAPDGALGRLTLIGAGPLSPARLAAPGAAPAPHPTRDALTLEVDGRRHAAHRTAAAAAKVDCALLWQPSAARPGGGWWRLERVAGRYAVADRGGGAAAAAAAAAAPSGVESGVGRGPPPVGLQGRQAAVRDWGVAVPSAASKVASAAAPAALHPWASKGGKRPLGERTVPAPKRRVAPPPKPTAAPVPAPVTSSVRRRGEQVDHKPERAAALQAALGKLLSPGLEPALLEGGDSVEGLRKGEAVALAVSLGAGDPAGSDKPTYAWTMAKAKGWLGLKLADLGAEAAAAKMAALRGDDGRAAAEEAPAPAPAPAKSSSAKSATTKSSPAKSGPAVAAPKVTERHAALIAAAAAVRGGLDECDLPTEQLRALAVGLSESDGAGKSTSKLPSFRWSALKCVSFVVSKLAPLSDGDKQALLASLEQTPAPEVGPTRLAGAAQKVLDGADPSELNKAESVALAEALKGAAWAAGGAGKRTHIQCVSAVAGKLAALDEASRRALLERYCGGGPLEAEDDGSGKSADL